MVLDPFAAVSLAANVVQFLDFGSRLISEAYEIYKDGASSSAHELEEIYRHLNELSVTLSGFSTPSSTYTSHHSSAEQGLRKLATSCKDVAQELLTAVHDLRVDRGPNRKWRSFRQALKSVWSKDKIDELQKRLDIYRGEMTLALSIILSDQQSSVIQEIKALKQENLRIDLNQGRKLDEITDSIASIRREAVEASAQSMLSRSNGAIEITRLQQLAIGLSKIASDADAIATGQRILGSLYFKTIFVRHSKIPKAHAKTFRWIFNKTIKTPSGPKSRLMFLDWLQSRSGIYWISGKAGSGKSTLMKYISDHSRTERALIPWAEPVKPIIASYYFWSAGTPLQKSQQGLFQSLLFDMFKQCPELIPIGCPSRLHNDGDFRLDGGPWDLIELTETMRRITKQKNMSCKFCFFIDGLDEYDGDHFELIKVLGILARSPNIKLCVSSRPWNVFEDVYGRNPDRKLCLQDLTRDDISRYVRNKLEEHSSWRYLIVEDRRYQELVQEITERAQGVFLWVFLVLRSLREGLTNGDSLSTLHVRLRRLPTDLEQFFRHMLDSLDHVYHPQMARTFRIALDAAGPLTLMTYSFLDDEAEDQDALIFAEMRSMDNYELLARHQQMKRRLNGRCKGLLEVCMDPAASDYFGYRVDFLHRTVRDFLRTKDMQQLLERECDETFSAKSSILKALLVLVKAMPVHEDDLTRSGSFQALLADVLWYARQIELETGTTEKQLLDEFERVTCVLASTHYCRILWYKDCHNASYDGVPGNARQSGCDSFLELSVQKGLRIYLEEKLRDSSSQVLESGRPLLDCALRICPSKTGDEPDLTDVVTLLLDRGEDPNKQLGNLSIWGRFLHQIALAGPSPAYPMDAEEISHRYRLIRHLLNRGADPNVSLSGYTLWGHFLIAISENEAPKRMSDLYLETLALFLRAGANPNAPYGLSTIWKELLSRLYFSTKKKHQAGALLDATSSVIHLTASGEQIAPHRVDFMHDLITKLLLSGADKNPRIHGSLPDLITAAFPARYATLLRDIIMREEEAKEPTEKPRRGWGLGWTLSWMWS